jgi:Ran GTPase-activating protein (RanGAP) involved in mRNA processing and transport
LGGVEVLFDEEDEAHLAPSEAVLRELHSTGSTFSYIASLRVEKAPGESSADYGARLAIALPHFHHLRVLNLSSMGLRSEVFEAVCPVLPESLEELDLSENGLAGSVVAFAAALPRLRSLRSLNVSHTEMDATALSTVAPVLPRTLTLLDLSFNKTNDRSVYASLAAALPPRLLQLRMTDMTCDDECVAALAGHLPPTLRELLLSNNEIGPKGITAFASTFPKALEVLCLRSNPLGDKGALALAGHLPPTLRELLLTNTGIREEGINALAPRLPRNLEALYLVGNPLGDEGAVILARHLPGLPSLTHLWLSLTGIHEKGAAALCSVLPERLEELGLEATVLGETGTRALATRLPGLRSLQLLDLTNVGLTNAGMALLAPSLPESLIELGLQLNLFTCEGMGPLLTRAPALRRLTRLTLQASCSDVLEEMKRQIPQCYIDIG